MGIAAADFDQDGRLDMHITNFSDQSSSFYLQRSQDRFDDLAPMFRLPAPTIPMVGFGTQPLDADLDGDMDLVVINGHVQEVHDVTKPLRMKPQILNADPGKFSVVQNVGSETEPNLQQGYFDHPNIGRALAKLDWNRDGKMDLVASHLDRPAALLENQTVTSNNWLQICLVGTISERDGIGARVVAKTSEGLQTQWRTAGDGYFCSNEPVLSFGLGPARRCEQVTVHWPSGKQQTLQNVPCNRRYLIVEGEKDAIDISLFSQD